MKVLRSLLDLNNATQALDVQKSLLPLFEEQVLQDKAESAKMEPFANGEDKSPKFLALNAFGQVPAFEHGDLSLFVTEKELSQLHQAQSALGSANSLFDSRDYTKALDLIDKMAKILKVKLLFATKDYAWDILEVGFILKEDEDNLDALLLRGHAYY
ncbi:DnaJ protein P58IPK [Tanacetum coccineum]|uniref:DnaJ protein P58IPK n=1 Tax=Tanacetum coccineum TaxID=301880 RepID=A0ABQ5CYI3_9ASTR